MPIKPCAASRMSCNASTPASSRSKVDAFVPRIQIVNLRIVFLCFSAPRLGSSRSRPEICTGKGVYNTFICCLTTYNTFICCLSTSLCATTGTSRSCVSASTQDCPSFVSPNVDALVPRIQIVNLTMARMSCSASTAVSSRSKCDTFSTMDPYCQLKDSPPVLRIDLLISKIDALAPPTEIVNLTKSPSALQESEFVQQQLNQLRCSRQTDYS